jgi:hypothetical protein
MLARLSTFGTLLDHSGRRYDLANPAKHKRLRDLLAKILGENLPEEHQALNSWKFGLVSH